MKIVRGSDPGPVSKYGDYKSHLQPLFRSRCAYCISHEKAMGGFDAMEVDHFRPLGRPEFKHLGKEWTNLYYACRLCNGSKSKHWPTSAENECELRFIDPCEDDPDNHILVVGSFENGGGFLLRDLTPAGRYTIDKIRLNRKQLKDIRRELARQEYETHNALNRICQQLEWLANDAEERGTTPDVEAVLRLLKEEQQRILRRIEEQRLHRPFLVDEPAA